MRKLEIKNLHVSAENNEILKGIDVTFETGKVYAVIGPNGHGKSTLLSSIMGDPNFDITNGTINLDGKDITEYEVDERANEGLYLLMQNPSEIEGVSNMELMHSALEKRSEYPISPLSVYADAKGISKKVHMDDELIKRDVNVGFSGGEKKKNELLHLFLLKPSFAFLDEVDSGLDVDSINAVSDLIVKQKSDSRAFIIISHYKKLYEKVKPDFGIVIKNGQVSKVVQYDELMNILEKGFDSE